MFNALNERNFQAKNLLNLFIRSTSTSRAIYLLKFIFYSVWYYTIPNSQYQTTTTMGEALVCLKTTWDGATRNNLKGKVAKLKSASLQVSLRVRTKTRILQWRQNVNENYDILSTFVRLLNFCPWYSIPVKLFSVIRCWVRKYEKENLTWKLFK